MAPALLFSDVETCADAVIRALGPRFYLAMPLGLGKPVPLANAFYRRAKSDPGLHLTIVTALQLEVPRTHGQLERRLMAPIAARLWPDVENLEFASDLRDGRVPPNVEIRDFFISPGANTRIAASQQNHCSANYTHIARDMFAADLPLVLCQQVARRTIDGQEYLSDSCSSDFRTDIERLRPLAQAAGRKFLHVAMVQEALPFMYGDAVGRPDRFDMVIYPQAPCGGLFAVPKRPVAVADHLIGLHVAGLIRDGGTLQVGIGSLGDAVAYGLILRQRHNAIYRRLQNALNSRFGGADLVDRLGGRAPFDQGLYGCSEMLVEPFIDLYREGILKRRVYDHAAVQELINDGILTESVTAGAVEQLLGHCGPVLTAADFAAFQRCNIFDPAWRFDGYCITTPDQRLSADLRDRQARRQLAAACHGRRMENGVIAHGAFFIGSQRFYAALNAMDEDQRRLFAMTGVAVINQLYGDEPLRRVQRRDARFCNSAMMVTALGGAVSDTLNDGTVISGVGGQYNFVAMAPELPGGRSIMMLRSTREKGGRLSSNIVYTCGNLTIPRHLRDIVVTEYGIADLRGKTDRQVIEALLAISDARFQDELATRAKRCGKLPRNWRLPERGRANRPENLQRFLAPWRRQGLFPAFPFGCDLTPVELDLARALRGLKQAGPGGWLRLAPALLWRMRGPAPARFIPHLERMALDRPRTPTEHLLRRLVIGALARDGPK